MAYNPYFPVTYQPYYYQPAQQVQPVIQPQQQTQPVYQPQQTLQNGIIWVSGEQEASMYPIAPNNAVALWEKTGKTIYLKSADATGKPTVKIYDLIERSEMSSDGVSASDGKLPDYATKDELGAVLSAIKGYEDMVGSIKSDVDTIKTDMYGIAGKKKPVRKAAADDDDE